MQREYAKTMKREKIKERRCNMREYTIRDDGLSNTITTVTKDNYVIEFPICVAMRGRYGSDGKIQQNLEPRTDGLTNTITTVQKDNMVLESH